MIVIVVINYCNYYIFSIAFYLRSILNFVHGMARSAFIAKV